MKQIIEQSKIFIHMHRTRLAKKYEVAVCPQEGAKVIKKKKKSKVLMGDLNFLENMLVIFLIKIFFGRRNLSKTF